MAEHLAPDTIEKCRTQVVDRLDAMLKANAELGFPQLPTEATLRCVSGVWLGDCARESFYAQQKALYWAKRAEGDSTGCTCNTPFQSSHIHDRPEHAENCKRRRMVEATHDLAARSCIEPYYPGRGPVGAILSRYQNVPWKVP